MENDPWKKSLTVQLSNVRKEKGDMTINKVIIKIIREVYDSNFIPTSRKYWPSGYWTNSYKIVTLDKMENLNCPVKMKEIINVPMKKNPGSKISKSDFHQTLKKK